MMMPMMKKKLMMVMMVMKMAVMMMMMTVMIKCPCFVRASTSLQDVPPETRRYSACRT